MKTNNLNFISALLLLVAMAFVTNAWATTKTVTYTITSVEHVNNNTCVVTFTRSGNTPFGGGSTTYTVSIPLDYLGQNGGAGQFSVDLADGFHLNLSWPTGSNIDFMKINSTNNYCIRPQTSGKKITYSFSCHDANYYVTHLTLTGMEGTWTNSNIEVSQQWNFSQSITSGYSLSSVTFTYADAPTLGIFDSDGENAYKIQTKDDLYHLANYVNNGPNNGSGLTFRQTQNITCDNTYRPIGNSNNPFSGTYDGQGNTISGIIVSKEASNLGFFGYINGGTVKDLVISNSTFSGIDNIGAIAGTNAGGTIQNCLVESNVNINFRTNSTSNHGGIVGSNGANASIIGCRCAAKVIGTGCSSATNYGGLSGSNEGTIRNCLYTGNQVNGNNYNGTLVGSNSGNLTNNYYTDNGMPGGLGISGQTNGNDCDGARRARTVTTGEDVVFNGVETAFYNLSGITAIGMGNCAMRYNNTLYSGATQNLIFSYTGLPALGYAHTGFSATNGGTFSGNILTMPNASVTVTAILTDVWGITNGADGTSDATAYIISDTTGLNLLARNVNGTHGYTANKFQGKYFKLGDNITYSYEGLGENESNYTPIGLNDLNDFGGIFDGDNHTVSGIRIHTTADNQGLFGWVEGSNSAVMNVTISDAVITGGQQVGGIAGYISSELVNCLVHGTSLSGTEKVGAIAGFKTAIGYQYYHNYYRNCTVNGTANAINVGLGAEPGYGNNTPHDNGGARSLHTMTLGDNITATGETKVIDNITYYASASTITLTYGASTEGYTLSFQYNDGNESHTVTLVEDVYSFTMPPADVTVSSIFTPIVYHITYDLAGGSVHPANDTTYTVETPTFTLINPAFTGYAFLGWTGTDLNEPTQTVTITQGSTGDRSYTATWTVDVWGVAGGADGSEAHPYIITSTTGLDLLATLVNEGNKYEDTFFKLGANIEYDTAQIDANGENYTPIGHQREEFYGTFDGCGYTVSGIRINKTGKTDDDTKLGLFGSIRGTVKNVTLSNAYITGYSEVGGIVGYIYDYGTVENCRVTSSVTLHAVKDNAYHFGGIAGSIRNDNCTVKNCFVLGATIPTLHYTGQDDSFDASGAIAGCFKDVMRHNYYHSVTIGGIATNIGVGYEDENYDRHDIIVNDGARAVHALTLGTGIMATPDATVAFNNICYYTAGTTITLNAEGYTLNGSYTVKDAQNNDITLTNGNTFVMPASDVTVSADLTVIDWDGNGSEGNPYMIKYRSQLDLLATRVNSGNEYENTFFKLDADIHYPHTTAWDDVTSTENNFTVIGLRYRETDQIWPTRDFKGCFDGDGHTISGIRIYMNTGKPYDTHQGLFGCVAEGGTVKNVTLSDARITGWDDVGGIAGSISQGAIENCHVTGTVAIHTVVDGAYCHGGIVGYNVDGTVVGCSSAATLTMAIGLSCCSYYGGIMGGAAEWENQVTVKNCLAVGCTISATEIVGAIFGDSSGISPVILKNYYYGCSVNGITSNTGSGYGDIANNDAAMPCYKLILPTGVSTKDTDIFNFEGHHYVAAGQRVTLAPAHEGYSIGSASYNDGSDHDITPSDGYYSFDMPAADITVSVTWSSLPTWNGHGTAESPYLITNCAELDALAIRVNNGTDYTGEYFKLGNDIDYPHATEWNDTKSTENNYTAIGNYNNRFEGTFDGDGHTISGIRIYRGGSDLADNRQGLFGYTYNACVRNIILSNTRITGKSYVGGIVGESYGTSYESNEISNCHVTATVAIHAVADDSDYHGGIGGSMLACNYCTSSATLSTTPGFTYYSQYYGGVSGAAFNCHCLAEGVTISGAISESGAIIGVTPATVYPHEYNFYHNCKIGDATTDIGTPSGDKTTDFIAVQATEVSVTIPGYGETNGKWAFIASPMQHAMTPYHVQNMMATPVAHYDLYRFNQEAAGAEWQNYKARIGCNSNGDLDFGIENGQGYLYASKKDVTLTFLGQPYDDETTEVTIPLSYTEGKPLAGYNLVGNPFTVDAYVNRPFYKMNTDGTGIVAVENYDNYTTAQTIPACTGIVVKANNNGESVIFSTTAPTLAAPNNGSLQITLAQTVTTRGGSSTETLDNAIVSFNEGSQLGKFYFGEQDANIYIPQDGEDYAIAYSDGVGEMPLNFKAKKNGEYTLSVETANSQLPTVNYLHLIDNLTGIDVDLLQTPSYTFTARYDDYASRFKLIFNVLGSDSENEDFAFISNGEIIVNGEGTLQVIDALGRFLFTKEITTANCQLPTSNYKPGVYVLRLINGENVKTQKIVIK